MSSHHHHQVCAQKPADGLCEMSVTRISFEAGILLESHRSGMTVVMPMSDEEGWELVKAMTAILPPVAAARARAR